jgi:hypothetical protein
MAVPGIANHIENIVNQQLRQKQEKPSETTATDNAANQAVSQDTFTPSAQTNSALATAQAAGIFQVNQAGLIPDTAPAQTTPNANQNALAVQASTGATTNAGAAQVATGVNPNAPAITAQPAESALAVQAATPVATAAPSVQDQIQSLNTALAALGLSNADIQQIDRIATVIQNFSPAAYTALVNQFQEAAQQASRQNAGPIAGSANATASSKTSANTNTGANANSGNFQVNGVSIHFAAPPEAANSAAANGGSQESGANNGQTAAANLQIQQVQITLTNGNGETIQVQAPQQTGNTKTVNPQYPQAQTAAA